MKWEYEKRVIMEVKHNKHYFMWVKRQRQLYNARFYWTTWIRKNTKLYELLDSDEIVRTEYSRSTCPPTSGSCCGSWGSLSAGSGPLLSRFPTLHHPTALLLLPWQPLEGPALLGALTPPVLVPAVGCCCRPLPLKIRNVVGISNHTLLQEAPQFKKRKSLLLCDYIT